MKNHIIIKFIAIFLCAASLLGAAGSGLGAVVLTGMDLYGERTVEEVWGEQVKLQAAHVADNTAKRYASENLGGCNETLASVLYGDGWDYAFDWNYVGYTLRDEEGNVLADQTVEGELLYTYDFSVSGQYVNLLDTLTVAEYETLYVPQETRPQDTVTPLPTEGAEVDRLHLRYKDGRIQYIDLGTPLGILHTGEDDTMIFRSYEDIGSLPLHSLEAIRFVSNKEGLLQELWYPGENLVEYSYNDRETFLYFQVVEAEIIDAVPPDGAWFYSITLGYADGSQETVGGAQSMGYVGYDEKGNLTVSLYDVPSYLGQTITLIALYDKNEGLLYKADDPAGLGCFALGEKGAMMSLTPGIQNQEIFIYDDIPPQGYDVYTVQLYLENGQSVLTIESETGDSIGFADHDSEGNVTFLASNWHDFAFSKPARVVYIQMLDDEGRVLYQSNTKDMEIGMGQPIGMFAYDKAGRLAFTAGTGEKLKVASELDVEAASESTETEEPTVPAQMEEMPADYPAESIEPESPTEAVAYEAVEEFDYYRYYDSEQGGWMMAQYTHAEMPTYTVEIRLAKGALEEDFAWTLLDILYSFRDYLIPGLYGCLLLFAVTAVYLCCAAGRKPGQEEVRAGGLNCIPLDLYLGGGALGEWFLLWLIVQALEPLLERELMVGISFGILGIFAICLLFVAFCFACAAQFKTPNGYWWRNLLCFRCCCLAGKCIGWFWGVGRYRLVPFGGQIIAGCWNLIVKLLRWLGAVMQGVFSWFGNTMARFFSLLPLTWQWLLVGLGLVLWLFVAVLSRSEFWLSVWVLAALGVALYGAHCFGCLLEAAKRMRKGDLDEKVDDKLMLGAFKDFSNELNGLAGVAMVAAQKQLKSERMKTELITNVSHDIKTPLTSIINYVDLMQKPHTQQEQEMYLEVLDRQSQRLKKLIDDLMEMSKASTGNLAVDIRQVDAAEAVNQALGEFADKLDKAQLTPVFRQPEKPIAMMADGRLVWRVMSNLLGNAVKYALPGTRVYLDLSEVDGKVILSMKNISRQELNVNADELLERFVRGDASRNTEGSGLGLNIAQSLMQLQKGQLQILVDGDLFKVTLIFPGA